jgi:hypothetical protein
VAQPAVLLLCSEAEVQAGLHSSSAQLPFAKLPYSKIVAAPFLLRRKLLLPQKTHNPKNNNANPHAHNLKK